VAQRLMTRAELEQWLLRKLGGPLICVELSQEQLDDAIDDAIEWFIAKKGIERVLEKDLIPNETRVELPDDVDTVFEVVFAERELDFATIFSPFAFVDKIPYDVFANPRGGGLYSSFVQSLQYIEMAKRIISVEPEWEVVRGERSYFLVYRISSDALGSNPLKAVIFYKPNCVTLEHLKFRDHDLIRRKALAEAKGTLSLVRGKYDAYPSAQGTLTLNADRLYEQAQEERDRLEEEIFDSGFPLGFLTG
jgi:hypothetical protein